MVLGKLSYWISKALDSQNYSSSSVLLVERAAHRHKYDNKLDKSSGCVQRVRADIADLVLAKVEAVEKSKGVVGVTKHLCGEATGKCIKNWEQVLMQTLLEPEEIPLASFEY